FAEGVDFSENGQALEAMRERNTTGEAHFLGTAHTRANFETAFWRSQITDNNSYEQWRDDGEKDASVRANALWKKMLADYEAPALDAGLDEQLNAFMAKRKETLPDGVS
ncbi:MAG: trimethylamine methyltransferase family protein, partial [Aestuariivirga sp.]